jgi:PAS domain-containing protein
MMLAMATPREAELRAGDEDTLRARIAELEEEVASLRRPALKRDQTVALIHQLMDHAPVGFGFFDTDCRYLVVNQQLAEMNGVPARDHVGRTVEEIVPGLAAKAREAFRQVVATGKPILGREVSGETAMAPGQLRHWFGSWYPVHVGDGKLLGVGFVVTEITGSRKTEDALRVSQQSLELAHAAAGIGTYDFDIATGVGRCSEHWRPLYGLPPSDRGASLEEWASWIHPEDRERVVEGAMLQIEGVPTSAEFRVIWPDGTLHWLFVKGNLICDAQGNPSRTVGVTMDITERKFGEAALRKAEERFRSLADTTPVLIWTYGRDERIEFANRFTLNFTGRTLQDLADKAGWSCIPRTGSVWAPNGPCFLQITWTFIPSTGCGVPMGNTAGCSAQELHVFSRMETSTAISGSPSTSPSRRTQNRDCGNYRPH